MEDIPNEDFTSSGIMGCFLSITRLDVEPSNEANLGSKGEPIGFSNHLQMPEPPDTTVDTDDEMPIVDDRDLARI